MGLSALLANSPSSNLKEFVSKAGTIEADTLPRLHGHVVAGGPGTSGVPSKPSDAATSGAQPNVGSVSTCGLSAPSGHSFLLSLLTRLSQHNDSNPDKPQLRQEEQTIKSRDKAHHSASLAYVHHLTYYQTLFFSESSSLWTTLR